MYTSPSSVSQKCANYVRRRQSAFETRQMQTHSRLNSRTAAFAQFAVSVNGDRDVLAPVKLRREYRPCKQYVTVATAPTDHEHPKFGRSRRYFSRTDCATGGTAHITPSAWSRSHPAHVSPVATYGHALAIFYEYPWPKDGLAQPIL